MRQPIRCLAGLAVGLLLVAAPLAAQEEMSAETMREVVGEDLVWTELELPGFLPGLQLAPVHGDPSADGEAYVVRLRFPDGYRFPPHWHPRAENVTVLEGSFQLAMGEAFDEAALNTYSPGDYLFIAGENPHFGQVSGVTVLQLHGMGPFAINVVEGQEMGEETDEGMEE